MPKVNAIIKKDPYKVEITSPTGNLVIADEPVGNGGQDAGLSPKELLAAALSACTMATLRMYVDKKGWDLAEIKVETELLVEEGKSTFSRKIQFTGTLTEAQKTRLLAVANACPVHKILSHPIAFNTEAVQ